MRIFSISGNLLHEDKEMSLLESLKNALEAKTDLSRANLSRANLYRANLYGADLSRANLYRANLYGADLSRANLYRANLSGANLSRANLYGADLSRADLYVADLSRANLYGANLYEADLYGADLSRANLSGADLYGADLSRANLSGANLSRANLYEADLYEAETEETIWPPFQICPEVGSFVAWKAVTNGGKKEVIQIEIPAGARRTSSLIGRKSRAEYVKVLAGSGYSPTSKNALYYKTGETIKADSFDPDPTKECTHGIHFFLTRKEAEKW